MGEEKRRFECAACHIEFSTTTTGDEMEREYVGRYGHASSYSDDENVSVCDACNEIIVAAKKDGAIKE